MTRSLDWLRDFVASMPEQYRDRHDARAVADHARLAARRTGRAAAGAFRSSSPGLPLCVVAPDAPGLLATISAAPVLGNLDVISAEAWCRTTPTGEREAVDLFWVRDSAEPARVVWGGPEQIARFRDLLLVLLDGTFDRAVLAGRLGGGRTAGVGGPRLRFVRDDDGALLGVDVETLDRPGLLFALSNALFNQRLEITRSEARTIGRRVFDRFYFREIDGSAVAGHRARAIEAEVAVALRTGAGRVTLAESDGGCRSPGACG